jgi:pyruvate dehydrogenase E2 component (dihydrolipoamide acetyltransferase)
MATKVHMEALSPTMEEGQVVRWLKNEGDAVKEGDVLAEIETDKATMELVARGEGVLRKQMLGAGQTAPVGTVIGVIAAPDEDISAVAQGSTEVQPGPTSGETAPPPTVKAGAGASAAEKDMASAANQLASSERTESDRVTAEQGQGQRRTQVQGPGQGQTGGNGARREEGGRVKASPLARRLAAEAGLELGAMTGTGPGGRIVRRDVESARTEPQARPAAARAPAFAPAPMRPAAERPEVEEIPVTQMRKTIAKRLVTSIGPVPTFYLTVEVDMTQTMAARERLNARVGEGGTRSSVNDFVVKAVAEALRRHPEVNASWGDSVIRRYGRVHVGVAVAVEDGLITPVVKDADRKGILQISAEVRALAGRARERKLQPEDYTGSTFSISNLGMLGIDEFTAIINPPEAAILAVGRVQDKPVVVNGQVVVQPRMRMTMSCDHRIVDGATGARFLQTLKDFLEDPAVMLA